MTKVATTATAVTKVATESSEAAVVQVAGMVARVVARAVAICKWDIHSSGPKHTSLPTETRGLHTSRCMAVEAAAAAGPVALAAGPVALAGSVAVVVAGKVSAAARPVRCLIWDWP